MQNELSRDDLDKIRAAVKPGDGWSGDEWELALCEEAIAFSRRAIAESRATVAAAVGAVHEDWKDQLYAAMEKAFDIRKQHGRQEVGGLVIDDTQVGVEFAMEFIDKMFAAQQTQAAPVPNVPTEEMLNAARDWSVKKYGQGIGNDAAIGCWTAMLAATPAQSPASPQTAPDMRSWTLLLTGPEHGLVGPVGAKFAFSPECNERVTVYAAPASPQEAKDAARLEMLVRMSPNSFVLIDQKWHLVNPRGRTVGSGNTKIEAIDAAMSAPAEPQPSAAGGAQ